MKNPKKENVNLIRNVNDNNSIKKDDYIHIPNNKNGNCFFRSISVYLTDTQDNYNIIRELVSEYAKNHREIFINFFVNDNINEILGSIELNNYIDNISKDGEYAGIIEMSITTKIFNFNIYVHEEDNNNNNYYYLYEKIDSDDSSIPKCNSKCNLLYDNGNQFSILLEIKVDN